MRLRRTLASVALSLVALVGWAAPAEALPAFARRFNLACGACHTAVPRLNAYGEAFHENGFKPPGTMWTPLPGNVHDGILQTMAVWTRGEFYEHSDYRHDPTPRGGFAVPEFSSIYIAGPILLWIEHRWPRKTGTETKGAARALAEERRRESKRTPVGTR